MKLKVILEPGEQSGFVARIPALPGCWSQGSSREEALSNVREAAEAWLETQQDRFEVQQQNSNDVELINL